MKYKYCDCFLEYTNFKDDLTQISNYDNTKLILLLQKDVYSHEHTDDWKKLNETSLLEK